LPHPHLMERAFAYCSRFAVATTNLGWKNALRTFRSIRKGSTLCELNVPRLGRSVFYRSGADKGAISHLFYPGTRIIDTADCPVLTIVDAGANIGIETIRMRHFHPRARVLAIEPDRENYAVLRKNTEQDAELTEALPYGVWPIETGLKVLPGTTNEGFSVRPVEPHETADVHAITMNAILESVGGEIDILKMDIEGAEFEVFGQNTEWVDHVKAFVFECPDRDRPGAAFQIFRAVGHLPLDTFISGESLVMIRKETGWKVDTTPYL
jgi:FkbM family methyltransferase